MACDLTEDKQKHIINLFHTSLCSNFQAPNRLNTDKQKVNNAKVASYIAFQEA